MKSNQVYYIFSTDQSSLSHNDNAQNEFNALNELFKREHVFTRGIGTYQGVKESSFLVQGEHSDEAYIKRICSKYNQECYLKVFSDNVCYMIDTKTGNETFLGKMLTSDAASIKTNGQDYSLFNNVLFQVRK